MRTSSRLLLLFGLAALASGCNCVGREITLTRTFQVNATDSLCDDKSGSVNLNDDSTFTDIKQFVGKVELRKVVLTVTNPKTDASSVATKGNGTVSVGDANNQNLFTLSTYTDVPITQGSTRELTFDAAAAGHLADLVLNPPNTFYFNAHGCNDAFPAHYEFKVDLTVYIGVL